MKTPILLLPYRWKKLINATLFFIAILVITLISACPPDDEDTWRVEQDGILSSWILKSAEFREMVDLDGPGNMLPTTDAKSVLFDIFNVYGNCSSIEEIAFRFTDEPPMQEDVGDLFTFTPHYAEIDCPEGMGISSWVFDYAFIDNSSTDLYDYIAKIYVIRKDINDPLELFDWQGVMVLRITSSEIIDGRYTFSGYSYQAVQNYDLVSSLPDPKPDLTFDFVFERVDPHMN
jgi:hypothetical protein